MTDSLFFNYPIAWLNQTSDLLGLSSYQIMSAVLLLSMAIAFGALLSNVRKAKHLNEKIEKLQHDLLVTNSGAKGMGQQLLAMEKQILLKKETASPPSNNLQTEKTKHTLTKVTPLRTRSDTAPPVNKSSAPVRDSNEKINFSALMNTQKEDDSDTAYDEVKSLLSQGFDINHVIKQSGLSHAEVSLISTLHHKAGNNTHSQALHR